MNDFEHYYLPSLECSDRDVSCLPDLIQQTLKSSKHSTEDLLGWPVHECRPDNIMKAV